MGSTKRSPRRRRRRSRGRATRSRAGPTVAPRPTPSSPARVQRRTRPRTTPSRAARARRPVPSAVLREHDPGRHSRDHALRGGDRRRLGRGRAGGSIPVDGFSVRWSGSFGFQAGDTTFTATADDGIRLWVDGTLLIDQWIDQAPTSYSATRTLTAGVHDVRVEYYEGGGGAVARLTWSAATAPPPTCSGGFQAQYFANTSLAGPATLARCEAGSTTRGAMAAPATASRTTTSRRAGRARSPSRPGPRRSR